MYNIYNYKVWKININTAPEIKKKSVYIPNSNINSSVSCSIFLESSVKIF